jgi:hypothetical protein
MALVWSNGPFWCTCHIFHFISDDTACQFEIEDTYHYAKRTNVLYARFLNEMTGTPTKESKEEWTCLRFGLTRLFVVTNTAQHKLRVFMIQIKARNPQYICSALLLSFISFPNFIFYHNSSLIFFCIYFAGGQPNFSHLWQECFFSDKL